MINNAKIRFIAVAYQVTRLDHLYPYTSENTSDRTYVIGKVRVPASIVHGPKLSIWFAKMFDIIRNDTNITTSISSNGDTNESCE